MTISTTYAPVQYTGNAVTTAFAFPYTFFDSTDLLVYLGGVLQASGYTVSGGSGSSGTVTFSSAPASGVIVTISLSLPYTQLDDYVENQAFPAQTLEGGLDKAALRDQQLNNRLNRALVFPDTLTGTLNGQLPQPDDGKLLAWSGFEGEVANVNFVDLSSSPIDTMFSSLATGDYLIYNGYLWVNAARPPVISNVFFATFANSPYNVSQSVNGYLLSFDTSGGNVVVNLPAISGLTVPYTIAVKKTTSDANTITINRSSSETIEGATSYTISRHNQGVILIADKDPAPDKWSVVDFYNASSFATPEQGSKADTALQNYNSPFLHLQDQKTSGTNGGTFTSGAWQTRTLNTEVADTIGSTLSSNQFTLPAGTYYFEAICPTLNTNSSQARLQNITDATTVLLGINNVTGATAGGVAFVNGLFTIAGTKTFELQHRCSLTRATDGFGYASGWDTEVYAEVRIWKVV